MCSLLAGAETTAQYALSHLCFVLQAKKKAKKAQPLVVGEGMMQRIVIGGSKKSITVCVMHRFLDPFRIYS
jgi:hypothetical protein